jgi:hypothetical protein
VDSVYYSGSKFRMLRWTGHTACMGEKRNAYMALVGKYE